MTQPQDPVCPACGEAVGATSTYCMHCDAEFDAPIDESEWAGGDGADDGGGEWGEGTDPTPASDWGDSDQSVTEHPSGWDDDGAGDAGQTEGWADVDESTTGAGDSGATADGSTASTTPETTSDYGTTGEPESESADAAGATGRTLLQSVARIGAVLLTVVVGIATTITLMAITAEVIELWLPILLVALVGIVTGGVVVARQDTGVDALADALYITAAAVVGLPIVFFLFLPTGDPILDRLAAGLIFSFVGAFVGVPAFLVGWWLQPDDEGITGI